MIRRLRYETCVGEGFYGFVRAVYDQVLKYAKLEPSELYFDWESVVQSSKTQSEILGESAEGSMFALTENGWFRGALYS